MVYDFLSKAPFILAIRQYSKDGPFYVIKVCKQTGGILENLRIEQKQLPSQWTPIIIERFKRNGDALFKKQIANA